MNLINTAHPVPFVPAKLPRIVVYLPENLKADLEKLAAIDHRSISSMTVIAIEQIIKQAKSEGKLD